MKLRIEIPKSSSKLFERVCKIARQIDGAEQPDGSWVIQCDSVDGRANEILVLLDLVTNITGTLFHLDGKLVTKKQLAWPLQRLAQCVERKASSFVPNYCCYTQHRSYSHECNFGCQLLDDHNESTAGLPSWWECGSIQENGVFKIDKERLLTTLKAESQKKLLPLCSNFDFSRVCNFITTNLPEKIDPKWDKGWEYILKSKKAVGIKRIEEFRQSSICSLMCDPQRNEVIDDFEVPCDKIH
jgi:hypothetical protein